MSSLASDSVYSLVNELVPVWGWSCWEDHEIMWIEWKFWCFLCTAVQNNLFCCSSEHSEIDLTIVLITTIDTTSFNHPPAPTETWLQAFCNSPLSLLNSCSAQNWHCSRAKLPWQLSLPGCRDAALEARRTRGGKVEQGTTGAGDGCGRAIGNVEADQGNLKLHNSSRDKCVPRKESHMLKRRK